MWVHKVSPLLPKCQKLWFKWRKEGFGLGAGDKKEKRGKWWKCVLCLLLAHSCALGLTHLRSNMDKYVSMADWARGEAGAYSRAMKHWGSALQCCIHWAGLRLVSKETLVFGGPLKHSKDKMRDVTFTPQFCRIGSHWSAHLLSRKVTGLLALQH